VLHGRDGAFEALATGLSQPSGVAVGPGGECFVAEQAAGRVVRLVNGRAETVLDGLRTPQGVLVHGERLYVVDAGAKCVVEQDLAGGERRVIAAELPVGAPAGIVPKPIGPIGTFAGPQGPFAGIAAGPDGALYVSGDAEGSVLELRRQPRPSAAAKTNSQDNRGR
jgi:glucose/arabinose dehydrogenase